MCSNVQLVEKTMFFLQDFILNAFQNYQGLRIRKRAIKLDLS
ncbi:Hypothetical Protein U712_03795 [Bacillus subtilis PY79]|nr:Hypothetical Protein U712_03795 [Bacillus subtilis PY79]EME07826.1 hypothetical protein BS732_1290 [Bacillus subtilis MB73/2]